MKTIKKKKNKVLNLLNKINIILFFLFVFFSFLKTFNLINFSHINSPTESMNPTIYNHDLLISRPITEYECFSLKKGDIVIFEPKTKERYYFICHRVIYNDPLNKVITAKGDNNKNVIIEKEKNLPYQKVYLKVIFVIPWRLELIIIIILFIYFIFNILFILLKFFTKLKRKYKLYLFFKKGVKKNMNENK